MGYDAQNSPVIGIDLGTTYSSIARWNGKEADIYSPRGERCFPSVIYYDERNDKYIFGNYNGDFIIYNEASNTIERKIDKVHSKCISFILRINDKMIASCSEDNSIKIWSID